MLLRIKRAVRGRVKMLMQYDVAVRPRTRRVVGGCVLVREKLIVDLQSTRRDRFTLVIAAVWWCGFHSRLGGNSGG